MLREFILGHKVWVTVASTFLFPFINLGQRGGMIQSLNHLIQRSFLIKYLGDCVPD